MSEPILPGEIVGDAGVTEYGEPITDPHPTEIREITETPASPGEEELLIEEEIEPVVDPGETKRLGRQQVLTDQVTNWLQSKDCHKFWRQFVGGACNKNLSYNTWPPEFQTQFDQRFNQMVSDPCFITTLCSRIIRMQNGHLVAAHVAGAFVVATAGFLSFALLEV